MFTMLLLSVILAAPETAPTPASAPAAANDLILRPDEGLTFVREPGRRVEHPGFLTPNEPDCQVFREDDRIVYRMWWTTQAYEAQAKLNETRWTSHVSISTDGLSFRYERGPEFHNGRTTNRTDRDLSRLPDGRWRAYTLVGGGDPWYCIDSYLSKRDARDWKWEPAVRIGFGRPGDMDHTASRGPEAVRLPGGQTRVYYIGWNGPAGPYAKNPQAGQRWRILSAISDDGLEFRKEPGVRMDVMPDADPPHGPVAMSKPQVVRLTDGRWRMYFAALPGNDAGPYGSAMLFSAVSRDGLTWLREPGIRLVDKDGKPVFATCPSLVRTLDGRLRIYYDGEGIRSGVTP
jgi:hypothetical protein